MDTQRATREHLLLPHLHDSLWALPAPHLDQLAPPLPPVDSSPRTGGEAKTPDTAPHIGDFMEHKDEWVAIHIFG